MKDGAGEGMPVAEVVGEDGSGEGVPVVVKVVGGDGSGEGSPVAELCGCEDGLGDTGTGDVDVEAVDGRELRVPASDARIVV